MKDILKSVVDGIFSFWTFMLIMGGLFAMIIIQVAENEEKVKAETQSATEVCYAQGMVLVQSDAGPRCASPQSLVKVK